MVNSYFICVTQTSNLGDLMINKMLVDELCRYGKVFLDARGIPDSFKKPLLENENVVDVEAEYHFTVKRMDPRNVWRMIKLFKKYNIKFITRSPGPLGLLGFKNRFGFHIINSIAKIMGASVCYCGNCASRIMSLNIPLKSEGVSKYFLRSDKSVEYVSKFVGDRVSYIPDLAFLMKYNIKTVEKKKIIGFDFRPVGTCDASLIERCLSIINQFVDKGFDVVLYYQVQGDKQFIKRLYSLVNNPRVSIREEIVWYDDLSFYSDKMFIISNRLHSLLFGAVYGALPICIYDDCPQLAKIKHVFNSSFGYNNPLLIEGDVDGLCDLSTSLWLSYIDIFDKIVNESATIIRNTINNYIKENCQ